MNSTSRRFSSLDTHPPHRRNEASCQLNYFEQTSSTHASADAHGYNDVRCAAAFALDQCVSDEAATSHPIRMAHCNRTAVDVQPVIGDTKLVATVNHLHSKRLIQFPQADVADFLASLLEQFRDGIDWPDAHFIGLASGPGEAAKDPHRL